MGREPRPQDSQTPPTPPAPLSGPCEVKSVLTHTSLPHIWPLVCVAGCWHLQFYLPRAGWPFYGPFLF